MARRHRTQKGKHRIRKSRPARSRGFVGRDGSPVLDRYPPKSDPSLTVRGPPTPAISSATSGSTRPSESPPFVSIPDTTGPPPAPSLISLERPFDVDEFAQSLGETNIRVSVPREELPEVLRRVTEFMNFGIYVYSIRVEPAPGELLRQFVVDLQRVDYSAESGLWRAFEEKGRSESPFGPGERR